MRSVYRGQPIVLTGIFIAPDNAPYSPTDVELRIYYHTTLVAGPILYIAGQIVRVAEGAYQHVWHVPTDEYVGCHTAEFSGSVAGDPTLLAERFDVVSMVRVPLPTMVTRSPVSMPLISDLWGHGGVQIA